MVCDKCLPCKTKIIKSLKGSHCDALLVIDKHVPTEFASSFEAQRSLDKAFEKEVSVFKDEKTGLPVVYSPVGQLTDYTDVRRYKRAAGKAIKRAVKSGYKNPALLLPSGKGNRFPQVEFCSVLGAFHELYVPIQLREDCPCEESKVDSLSIIADNCETEEKVKEALLFESARLIARDIGGGDPERMTPKNIEKYVKPLYNSNVIKMEVVDDVRVLQKEYPLFAAVNRAANSVDRHQGRIIYLEYKPSKPAKKTLMLVGKGVTADIGGINIKTCGLMGISRDKCGAAAVAGFMKIVEETKPTDIHVIAALVLVRNSTGEESYATDEILTSRAGLRVRIGNTDAEGRLAMADVLCRFKELAQNLPNPHLFTIATLTEHAFQTAGCGYSIVVDNSVASKEEHDCKLQATGQEFGEPFEISKLRPDDFTCSCSKICGEDLINCGCCLGGPRGHQIPAAFMLEASGLIKHGLESNKPLKYSHLDIAGSAGEYPATPTAAPIIALAKTHLC